MGIKSIYNHMYERANNRGATLERRKTLLAEQISVIRRHGMYDKVNWPEAQQQKFDQYWIEHYGRRISNKWHRIYESINGVFCIDYIPEIMYTTQIECLLNNFHYSEVMADKFLVDTLATAAGCLAPETLVICSEGRYFDHLRRPISFEKACSNITDIACDVVLKPTVDTGSGRNVHYLSKEKLAESKTLIPAMGRNFVVQKAIQQHDVLSSINPSSVNTLRVMTYLLNDSIYHMPIACRIGSEGSKIDNIHAGGLVVGVEDSGQLLPVAYRLGYGDNNERFTRHPTTGVAFSDVALPNIQHVIRVAYAAHGRLPCIGIVSWDFTVDKDSNPVLIEANLRNQSIWFPQIVHGKGAFGENTMEVLSLLRRI